MEGSDTDQKKPALDPAALTLEQAVRTLGLRREWLEADIAHGAPTNADGTLNLVHYGAWLNTVTRGDGDGTA